MKIITQEITLTTRGNTDIINITSRVLKHLEKTPFTNGLVTLFIPGATAAITTLEYEKGLIEDLKNILEKIAPERGLYVHNRGGDDNGHSHIRASLLGPSICIPFINKRLQLGRWQEIVFIDFDTQPRARSIFLQIIGEE
jgi:secondary thiamine-phosphate synthase enzyme